ncbi:hypothetical protein A5784_35005 [Mycobacterium sp. 852013-50091_SCH5140682]|uniref:hypothetical protein n=1 Tax=Mycobacterium sp. 852013-50091_SCH5140682 TaxID=1834109 RepID=UPI0007EA517A|nr:hypothetical protein [Mycobacterium sp. 852013-50091_SCH5140682]OBC11409.1 hypothetical protein A5784_35005 [Mycobacterium sp. 852013-50091_SCH5140682]
MRIRSTKPEFWRSERIASVSWDARLVLKGLESFVDDNGVGKDDIALIVGDLFQRDLVREPSRTLARVSEALTELRCGGLIWRYEANDTALLFVSFWETIQRVDKPQSGRFPRPDGTMNYKDSIIREPDAKPREDSRNLAPGTGEQRNRGTEEDLSLTLVEGGVGGDPSPAPEASGKPAADAEKPKGTARGTRLPDGWMPDRSVIEAMKLECPGVDLESVHREFVDYWRGVPGARGRKVDWNATWRNRVREVAARGSRYRPAPESRPSTTDQRVAAVQALKEPDAGPRLELA